MAERGLEGIDSTVQQTHAWLDDIASRFHGSKHEALQMLRSYLHALRDHLAVDESAQFAAQLPVLIRGLYYEGWDPSANLQHERDASVFLERFTAGTSIRQMDARDGLRVTAAVVAEHVSEGEMRQVLHSLPRHLRELVS